MAISPAILVGIVIVAVLGAFIILRKKTPKALPALDQREYRAFKLVEKRDVTQVGPGIMFKTTFFRFALPSPTMRLGLPVGQHISLRFTGADGKMISRPYTPVSSDSDLGYFDLLIKIYEKGAMGQYLDKLAVGATIDVKGPLGEIKYKGNGLFEISRRNEETKEKKTQAVTVRRLGMIAGGTGLTPMLQVVKRVLSRKEDTTQLSLIFANQTEADILLRGELEALAAANPDRFNLFFTIDNPKLPEPLPNWKGGRGFVSTAMISGLQEAGTFPRAGADSLVLLCGPPLMLTFVSEQLKKGLDFTDDMIGLF